ncbi:leucine-rich repeat neuronal protein 4 isoform X1 [Ranitomeya variabilis]|uniref:leucine-rich repeat neuronal protein 4 isoform X1 n=2 Tax=Ranitomeya variabilis TaxID=490064 RepID=UPI004056C47A
MTSALQTITVIRSNSGDSALDLERASSLFTDYLRKMMFILLLLVCKMGMLVALLSSTDPTVTVSKNLTEEKNITDTQCGEQCNVKCHLQNQNLDVLPSCLPTNTEDLNLNFNNITVIRDQDVVSLSKLRIMSLSHNRIKEINWKIHVLAELESLDLSNNQLSVVPKCLMLKNLTRLSLAENPILLIHPFAFSSFPSLFFLNLSLTLIGSDSSEDIGGSSFGFNGTEAQKGSLKSLQLLDLSGTYIRRVNYSWIKDLSNLRELHIRRMINMEVLEDDLYAWFPHLQFLDCAGSKRLHYVKMEIFKNLTSLMYIDFQNCSLNYLSPWKISSKSVQIDLRGNPLHCICEDHEWLLLNHENFVLTRPHETFCSYLKGDLPDISMFELHKRCKRSDPNSESEESVTPSTTMTPDYIQGTTEGLLTPRTIGQKYILTENTKDLTTTGFEIDSTTQSGVVSPNVSPKSNSESSPKELTVSVSTSDKPTTPHKLPVSGSSNGNQTEIQRDYTEEYDEEETQPSVTIVGGKMVACDYDHCRHLQAPCSELQLLKPCLCPGLSGDHIIPDPPLVHGVFEITDTSAQILWCAPNSIVEKYQLVYQPESGANDTVDNIYVTMREYTLYNLAPFTTYNVCVLAFNKKGHSAPTNGSRTPCIEFRTRPSYILLLSILSALGGLFLVTIAVLSACLHKACRNSIVSKYDTRLVSYKNPAFEYQCTIPSYH